MNFFSFNKAVTAALTGYHGQVRAYLEHGGDPNRREQNGGTTLLHAVCSVSRVREPGPYFEGLRLFKEGARRYVMTFLRQVQGRTP